MTTDADSAASAPVVLDASAVSALVASIGETGEHIAQHLADAPLLEFHVVLTKADRGLRRLERVGRVSPE